MLLSERLNGLKSGAFGDYGLSGSPFFMLDCHRLRGNSEVESDNSSGENDNTPPEKVATAEKNVATPSDNSHRQNQNV